MAVMVRGAGPGGATKSALRPPRNASATNFETKLFSDRFRKSKPNIHNDSLRPAAESELLKHH